MFESVYRDTDVARRRVNTRLRRSTAINSYRPLPSAVITASLAPAEAAKIVEVAIARSAAITSAAIDTAHFRVPLRPLRLLSLTGHLSASVHGSNIYLKVEASRVVWIAAFGSVAALAILRSTSAAVIAACAAVTLIALARVAAFRLF